MVPAGQEIGLFLYFIFMYLFIYYFSKSVFFYFFPHILFLVHFIPLEFSSI